MSMNRFEVSSRIHTSRASLLWKIENFSGCSLKKDGSLQSPVFTSGNTSWVLQLYPNGETSKSSSGNVGIYLMKTRSDVKQQSVSVKICLKDKQGNDDCLIQNSKAFIENGGKWGSENIINRKVLFGQKKEELMVDGTLTVFCSLAAESSVSHGRVTPVGRAEKKTQKVDISSSKASFSSFKKLSQDLTFLYEKRPNHDIILKTGGQDFPAHKAILQARSPFFSDMFEHDPSDNLKGVIVMDDIEAPILDVLLRYIYTGTVEEISSENVVRLYSACDMCALEELKAECTKHMSANVSINNICDLIMLAEIYNERDLKLAAHDYFFKNAPKVLASEEWKAFESQRPDVAQIMLKKFLLEETELTF